MKKISQFTISSLPFFKTSFIASLVFMAGVPGVQAELPVPHSTLAWSNNARIAAHTNNYMRIAQNQGLPGNWLLNWDSFNVSENSIVEFDQPSATHIALNQIYDINPSQILGSIEANGRVYLINQNGFLFGKNSSINVNSLVASSLAINMSDEEFINGDKNIATLINEGAPAFVGAGGLGDITLEQGAKITTQDGGNVLMFAPNIFNYGDIETTSGQAILAAAEDKVYLTPSTDPSLRGFLIEVGTGGTVENSGYILSNLGNITLAGLAVNQNGVLEATSSVNENGSIRLLARDSAEMTARNSQMDKTDGSNLILGVDINVAKDADGVTIRNAEYAIARQTGEVTLGEGSQIIIKPVEVLNNATEDDANDVVTLTDVQEQVKSRVEITGNVIRMQKNAGIVTPGGNVVIHATSNPLNTGVTDGGVLRARDDSKFIMQSGSRIDVSGTAGAQVEMARNQLEVQLTGNFLRDAPLQRDGELRNARVNVDIRDGTPLGDISELVAGSVLRGAVERFSAAGSVNVISQGGVLLENNSEINIRGGAVSYEEGYVTTSRLISSTGKIIDIADTDPNQIYTGVFGQATLISKRWGENSARSWNMFGNNGVTRFYQSYVEGRDGGDFNVLTHAAVLDNDLLAGTVTGAYQRDIANRASGGSANITLSDPSLNILLNSADLAQSVSFVDEVNNLVDESTLDDFLSSNDASPEWLLQINNDQINSGLSNITVKTNGNILLTENSIIDLASGGSLNLDGRAVEVNNDIKIASGNINIKSYDDLTVNSTLNTSGNWVNDVPFIMDRNLQSEINLQGGSIDLNSANGNLLLENSVLKVNGGAWLNSDGDISVGDAGLISLGVNNVDGEAAQLQLGEMQAYAAGRGGELKITTNAIHIANGFEHTAQTGELQFTAEFFQSNGFSDYTLRSNAGDLLLSGTTVLNPKTKSLLLNEDIKLQRSAENLSALSTITNLPDYLRPQTNLTLGSNRSANVRTFGSGLSIEQGSRIELEAGANLNLFAERNLFMNGELVAPGGDINLTLNVPSGSGIKEYEADQAIWLGGSIDVRGTFIEGEPNETGLLLGDIYNAGSVTLDAKRGYIVAGENSEINVSGDVLSQQIDLPSKVVGNTTIGYERHQVIASAGSIDLSSAEGMLLNGRLLGNAAAIAGESGGRLNVSVDALSRGTITGNGAGSTNGTTSSRIINLVQANNDLPEATEQGLALSDDFIGQAWLSAESIAEGGFSNLSLYSSRTTTNAPASRGVIALHDGVDLSLDQSLQMIAPIIRGNAAQDSEINLSAPYILLGSITGSQPEAGDLITDGNSVLNITAGEAGRDGLLELMGNIHLQNIAEVNLMSEGDIRLRGVKPIPNDTKLEGSLQSFGNLSLQADQIYATTLSAFSLNVTNTADGVLRFAAGGEHTPVLSAGSILNFNAPIIEQAGVIKAPQGQINFNATQQLTLADGGLTSVSGEGLLVPFGSTLGQERWTYSLRNNDFTEITEPPEKEINFQAPDIKLADTAIVDISGGGDLYSWEFVPGLGGSVDTLAPANANGAFAVIPGMSGYAPFDDQNWLNVNNVSFGDQIYLNGSELLAEGLYTVLPARYALLPNALLVTPTGNNLLPSQKFKRLDGAPIIAGRPGIAGTDFYNQLWSAYVVESGETIRERTEYFETTASQFFRNAAITNDALLPAMPEDAGTLNLLASNSLNLSGILRGDAGTVEVLQETELVTETGRGSLVNIGGTNLRVVNAFDDNGGIQLLDDSLNAFAATSLMLGGTRQRSEQGIDVTETATTITIENNAEINVPDLYLVSEDIIDVQSGATIIASGVDSQLDTRINLDGDGALLRASASEQIIINRINESATPATGQISIAQGATIKADKAITLDASSDTRLMGDLLFSKENGSLNLGASQISIGDVADSTSGLVFTATDLTELNANELVLTSRSSVGFFGDLDLSFNNLVIQAASLDGNQAINQNLILRAETVGLLNTSNETSASTPMGNGALQVFAENIVFGEGDSLIRGFDSVSLNATQGVFVADEGSLSSNANNVVIDAAVVSANTSSANYTLDFSSAPLTIKSSSSETVSSEDAIGASLNINAVNIRHQGNIRLASGNLSLQASGTAADDNVSLMDGSVIDVSGIERDFAGEAVYTSAGKLSLIASNGSVIAQLASKVNISGGGNDVAQGNAGSIIAQATSGAVNLLGLMDAAHGEQSMGGSLRLDANSVDNMSGLNLRLNNNGFDQQRTMRLRNGNLQIGANDLIVAENILLQADAGSVTVAGAIDARGDKGGRVHLAASSDINLTATGSLDASALSADGEGGDVIVETTNGFINLAANSQIKVKGGENYRDGSIYIRTSRNGTNNGVNITSVESNMTGFRRLDIEGFELSYINDGSVTAADLNTPFSRATAFMTNDILSGLNFSVATDNVHIRPGIELRPDVDVAYQENISLTSDINFLNRRYGNEAGVLTIRSEKDLNINKNIDDGFDSALNVINFSTYDSLQSGESWSYNLIAGADFSSANGSLSTDSLGELNISSQKRIRTGTGDILLSAATNINLGTDAAVYTAGQSNGRGSMALDVADPAIDPLVINILDGLILPEVEFPEDGGDINITAGGEINANASSKLVTDWLHRVGDKNFFGGIGSTWGIFFDGFKHGVAALGGGDINVMTGGDINNLAVAIPETGKQVGDFQLTELDVITGAIDFNLSTSIIERNGRGDLSVNSDGDITAPVYYVGNGQININAAKNIGSETADSGLYLISANTQNNISAGGSIYFQGANNQTMLPISKIQEQSMQSISIGISNSQSYYSTLADDTEINLNSLSGDVVIRNTFDTSKNTGPFANIVTASESKLAKDRIASILPGRFNALSVDGNIDIENSIILWPSDQSMVSLMADKTITGNNLSALTISMLDTPQEDVPDALHPAAEFTLANFPNELRQRSSELTHVGSTEVSRLIANQGDITSTTDLSRFEIQTNQQTEIIAGRDVSGISLNVQHSNESDISVVQAGRDMLHINGAQLGTTTKFNSIKVAGPGELHVLAGRNINLGDQKGIISAGNNSNPALPNNAAELVIMAGLGEQGADYNAFINGYFTEGSEYADQLVSFMQSRDSSIESFEPALAAFSSLQEKQQRTFVLNAFANEYRESAIRAASEQNDLIDDGNVFGYSRGLDAIATLFPGTIVEKRDAQTGEVSGDDLLVTGGSTYVLENNNQSYAGNISMVASTIQTQDNGADISILTPGGFLNVGLSVAVGDDNVEKGIITKGDGAIDIYAFGDVAVNQSRIQALNTGDVTIWSTQGDIDAGRGAKSALSFPPPRNVVDPETGAIIQVLDAAVQGNGIRTACFDLSCKAGDVVLAAPKGVIDAGDAGINSGSGIILATETVLNANQIEAGGESTGVPADASALGADLGGMDVNSAGEEAGTELIATDASDQFGAGSIAILQVEIMGLSDDLEKPTTGAPEVPMQNLQTYAPDVKPELPSVKADKKKDSTEQRAPLDMTFNL